MKRILKMTMVLFSLLILASCSFPGLASNTDEDTISITGGITSEAQILASLVAGMVEHYTDKNTAIINNLATTTINHQAMMNGDASISAARYTGTDLTTTLNLPPEKDPKKAFATVKDEFEKRYGQTWFPSYGFEN
ncbi:TPA: osmoprotectant ABC transporter substrate-binding protein, partial [Enterococcus faecium]|nr:osmoprotectant ABC transporter substrate-binding protein [Enterococcus faecium]